jgi:hypothetical protein
MDVCKTMHVHTHTHTHTHTNCWHPLVLLASIISLSLVAIKHIFTYQHQARILWFSHSQLFSFCWSFLILVSSISINCIILVCIETFSSNSYLFFLIRAGSIAQWYSTCLAYVNPWVWSLIPQEQKKKERKEGRKKKVPKKTTFSPFSV